MELYTYIIYSVEEARTTKTSKMEGMERTRRSSGDEDRKGAALAIQIIWSMFFGSYHCVMNVSVCLSTCLPA